MDAVHPAVAAAPVPADELAGRRVALAVLLLASTLTVMAGAVLAPVVAVLRDELDLSDTAAGLVLTAHGASLALASPFVGRAVDRWGVRGLLAVGLLVYAGAGGLGVIVDGYPALIASRLGFGVGAAAVFTATTVAVFRLVTGRARDRAMGWRAAAISVGGLVWPLVGGALGTLSWHAPFAVYLVGAPLALAVLVVVPADGPRDGVDVVDRSADEPRAQYGRGLLACYALQTASALLLYVMLVFVPLRLVEIGVASPVVAAGCNVALSGAMALVAARYARLRVTRGGDSALLRAALLTWIVAFGLAASVADPRGLLVACALFGIGMGVAVPALTVMVAERAPAASLGRATSLSATATFAVQPLSPVVFGPLVGATSITVGFGVAGALALVVLVLVVPRLR